MILGVLRYPIVLAPLAGGPSTPALTAAVSDAGGLGFLAAGYRTAEDMRAEIRQVRASTSAPFGVNLFVPGSRDVDKRALHAYVESLRAEAVEYGSDVGDPRFDDDDWHAKLEVLNQEGVPAVSFTFGCPPIEAVTSLREAGSEVWATATSVAEARAAKRVGVDAIVLQGIEAGGHRGSWVDRDDVEGLGVLALLRLVVTEIDLPLVAAGGISDGPAVAAVLAAGAAAAQLGTAFLRAPEAGTNPAHRAALATDTPTALTRAFTGRHARALVNRFLREHGAEAPIAYPHVHHATAPFRAEARRRGDADNFNLWAGQAHRLATERPAGEIVRMLARDAQLAITNAAARLEGDR